MNSTTVAAFDALIACDFAINDAKNFAAKCILLRKALKSKFLTIYSNPNNASTMVPGVERPPTKAITLRGLMSKNAYILATSAVTKEIQVII
uniref:Uncharacterized protein n=1 Tax=Romanomermis culicivorax TaxID=13658 RepID=A0A915HRX5_ROMCU